MRLFFFVLLWLAATPVFADNCKVVEYPDRNEVVCEGIPQQPIPPPVKTFRNINDAKAPERRAAIKSIIRLSSQSSIGVSHNNLNQLLGDALAELKVYESVTKNFSEEDDILITLINTATLSYELTLMDWKKQIESRGKDDFHISYKLSESSSYADKAISYYGDTWK